MGRGTARSVVEGNGARPPNYPSTTAFSGGPPPHASMGRINVGYWPQSYFSSAYCTVSVTEDPTCPGSTGVAGAASALNRAVTIIGMGGCPPLLLSASETSRAAR